MVGDSWVIFYTPLCWLISFDIYSIDWGLIKGGDTGIELGRVIDYKGDFYYGYVSSSSEWYSEPLVWSTTSRSSYFKRE